MSSPPRRIGFIGFGAVAAVLSEAIVARGAEVFAYDVVLERPDGRATVLARAGATPVRFVSLAELVSAVDCILSTVTTTVAVTAARDAAAHRLSGKRYIDLNATAPTVKHEVNAIVTRAGAEFIEGAILGAIGVTGAKTKILLGGAAADETAAQLTQLGLNTVFYSEEIGRASAFKLLRSVFSKGMEALLIEYLAAGHRAGIQADLWREIVELFNANSFEKVASNWVATHGTAHERRYHEVVQVSAELRALGVDPIMTSATERFFQRSCDGQLRQQFGGRTPNADEVVAAVANGSKAKSSGLLP